MRLTVILSISLLTLELSIADASSDSALHRLVVFSGPHTIDRVIKPMEGEPDEQTFTLLKSDQPELLWVTAGKVDILDADSRKILPSEMLCHSHLEFPVQRRSEYRQKHNALLGGMTHLDVKIFTVSQGQTEIRLPDHFGIPVFSDETFAFGSMIASAQSPEKPYRAEARGDFEFYRDRDLPTQLKPLFWRQLIFMVPAKPGSSGSHCSIEMAGSVPLEAEVPAKPSLKFVHKHISGKYEESYHWMVPPGRHQYHYVLERGLGIPFDTTLHYTNLHLHPYAESVELRDATTGKSIYTGMARTLQNGDGIQLLTHFSSQDGVPVYKNHQYELVSIYNNTTDHDIDAMAIMFVYLLDKDFDRSRLHLAARTGSGGPDMRHRPGESPLVATGQTSD